MKLFVQNIIHISI